MLITEKSSQSAARNFMIRGQSMVLNSAAHTVDNRLLQRRRETMNLSSVMRLSYLLAWVFAAIAIIYRLAELFHVVAKDILGISSRGVMFGSGLLFLAT